MARESRIAHPPGAIFVMLYRWAIDHIGEAGSAVLSTVEFWDRAHDQGGEWLGRTRDDIVHHLQGIVGRDRVHHSLDELVKRGWIQRREFRINCGNNFTIRHDLRLVPDTINQFLSGLYSTFQKPGVPETRKPEFLSSGHQYQRPTNKRKKLDKEVHHHPNGGNHWQDEWNAALEFEVDTERRQRPIVNLAGFKQVIRARYIYVGGPDADVLAEMESQQVAADQVVATRDERDAAELQAVLEARSSGVRPPTASVIGRALARLAASRTHASAPE